MFWFSTGDRETRRESRTQAMCGPLASIKFNKNCKKMKVFLISILVISLNSNYLTAQTNYEKIDSVLNSYFEVNLFNGSVIVSENGNVIYKNGFGFANFELNINNKPDTKFKIGSCTKQFTAALIMILNEEGKLSLDDKISNYIPEYPIDKGSKITIHNLLSHSSGIPEYFSLPDMDNILLTENNPDEFIKQFWNLDLEFEPGTKLKYSNSGYFVLGKIIENVTNQSYSQVLQEKIFSPLEMLNSGVVQEDIVINNKAYGYIKAQDTLKVAPYINASGAFSAGAIYSTVEDLFKWQNALQSYTILKKESLEKMLKPNFSRYGYGFGILNLTLENNKTITLYGHEGEISGFRSLIHFFKEDNSSIILLDNNQNTNLYEISVAIRKIIF
ncbi:MAG TPA: serine hydrolase domain-containing protein [Bacteroidales bacterium]|nr:serine hydrolase domain-containing protein [Bacteroidales bacterium]